MAEQETADSHRAIAARALGSADQFLGAAAGMIPSMAATLSLGPDLDALRELARLLDGVLSLARLSQDLGRVLGTPAAPLVDVEDMRVVTQRLVAVQEAQDWPGLGALLENDIAPRLAAWRLRFAACGEAI